MLGVGVIANAWELHSRFTKLVMYPVILIPCTTFFNIRTRLFTVPGGRKFTGQNVNIFNVIVTPGDTTGVDHFNIAVHLYSAIRRAFSVPSETSPPQRRRREKKKIGFIFEENHKFSADDKM